MQIYNALNQNENQDQSLPYLQDKQQINKQTKIKYSRFLVKLEELTTSYNRQMEPPRINIHKL